MNGRWFQVVIAAAFEVGWATGLKYANDFTAWTLTVIAIVVSFWLLINAAMALPTSTVYAIFVGLGSIGTVLVDIILFNAPINVWMLFFVALLLVGVIGLKMVTGEKEPRRASS
ncbi:multidrug efflux SMR transporter [Salicibibacter cibi]|uniref:Multidrug efflux SMR transporter n=1 Tax=Salicibibacter cibi TaxID=2743001 RepID=A0A7T6Z984_9BACI|nr:multidrug efflux SMR transporter [Salicibibacter cibi]QQK79150.1 multidrug efflux SMR transporter [Salicibibacter cibi]